ncbi:hypothetical protein FKP32DRAFT_1075847 [Trametes sanguinea]|nr:hypothetical protein FKP32DRAFT_1075847 [Trametes sanguinea]
MGTSLPEDSASSRHSLPSPLPCSISATHLSPHAQGRFLYPHRRRPALAARTSHSAPSRLPSHPHRTLPPFSLSSLFPCLVDASVALSQCTRVSLLSPAGPDGTSSRRSRSVLIITLEPPVAFLSPIAAHSFRDTCPSHNRPPSLLFAIPRRRSQNLLVHLARIYFYTLGIYPLSLSLLRMRPSSHFGLYLCCLSHLVCVVSPLTNIAMSSLTVRIKEPVRGPVFSCEIDYRSVRWSLTVPHCPIQGF